VSAGRLGARGVASNGLEPPEPNGGDDPASGPSSRSGRHLEDPPDKPSADEVLRATGLLTLSENPPLEAVEKCLERFAAASLDSDELRRAILRDGAVQALKEAGTARPAHLVDAALAQQRPRMEPEEGRGRRLSLTDPEPWPSSVDGGPLLEELTRVFSSYLALPRGADIALALWTLHAHAHSASAVSPILGITSATKRCGKSTALAILQRLVPRALPASNITPAALFRAIEAFCPTFLIDEADTFLATREELRGVLNSGHSRSGAWVVRTAGDDHEVRQFSTWCPKAIAMIGELPGTLSDRAVEVRLQRRRSGQRLERLRLDRLEDFEPLHRRCSRWVRDHLEDLRKANPEVPAGMNDRASDNWRPLLAIADRIGGAWPAMAREAALWLSRDGGDEGDMGVMLLRDLQKIFSSAAGQWMASADLVAVLGEMEDRPWPEWRRGQPITPQQLAALLRPFGVKPSQFKSGKEKVRGYSRDVFRDPWARYFPESLSKPGTPVPFRKESHFGRFEPGTIQRAGTDPPSLDSPSVAPKVPGYRAEREVPLVDPSDDDYERIEREAIQLESEGLL
jgi:hypothetical protein